MSIETLNTAARAAGFAMVTDEASQESKAEAKAETETLRSDEDMLLQQEQLITAPKAPSTADWVKSLFGAFGRRAPA